MPGTQLRHVNIEHKFENILLTSAKRFLTLGNHYFGDFQRSSAKLLPINEFLQEIISVTQTIIHIVAEAHHPPLLLISASLWTMDEWSVYPVALAARTSAVASF